MTEDSFLTSENGLYKKKFTLNGYAVSPELKLYKKLHLNSLLSILNERCQDIEKYITACTYYYRDFMPHNGRYYNRKKWLSKLGLWNYD